MEAKQFESEQSRPLQMAPHVEEVERRPGRIETWLDRIGPKTLGLLIGSLAVEIAAIGFISYLWYGDNSKVVWHQIVSRNWTIRAVTLTSLALRLGIAVQGGLCISMLAAVTVERFAVPVQHVADVSLMRAGSKTDLFSVLLGFLYPMVRSRHSRKGFQLTLALALAILTTVTLAQFASTALVGDIGEQMIPGKNRSATVAYEYPFTNAESDPNKPGGSTFVKSQDGKTTYGYTYPSLPIASLWEGKTPPSWPAFAEYSEPAEVTPGIDDTGLTLRAFLPYAEPQARTSIRNYTGRAMVMDTRVSCRKPQINEANIQTVALDATTTFNLVSTFNGSFFSLNETAMQNVPKEKEIPFECIMVLGRNTLDWSICQLLPGNINPTSKDQVTGSFPGGLNSVLREKGVAQTGTTFLVFLPIGPETEKKVGLKFGKDSPYGNLNLNLGTAIGPASDLITGAAITMCHASLDVADRFIEADSSTNRSEPFSLWDTSKKSLDMSDVAKQLDTGHLTGKKRTAEERGILRLKGRKDNDWSAKVSSDQVDLDGPEQLPYVSSKLNWDALNPTVLSDKDAVFNAKTEVVLTPYLLAATNIQGGKHNSVKLSSSQISKTMKSSDIRGNQLSSNWTAVLAPVGFDSGIPDENDDNRVPALHLPALATQEWMPALMNNFKDHPALALQSILTSIAGQAYYDRITQYTKQSKVSETFFVNVQSPGGPFGTKRTHAGKGYIAVIFILFLHLALVGLICWYFVAQTRSTRLGDGWQAVSQVALSEGCRPLMETSASPGGRSGVDNLIHREHSDHHVSVGQSGNLVKFERTATV